MASKFFSSLPSWVQLGLAVSMLLVTITLAFGSVRTDMRIEAEQRRAADALLQEKQDATREDIKQIREDVKYIREKIDREFSKD